MDNVNGIRVKTGRFCRRTTRKSAVEAIPRHTFAANYPCWYRPSCSHRADPRPACRV